MIKTLRFWIMFLNIIRDDWHTQYHVAFWILCNKGKLNK